MQLWHCPSGQCRILVIIKNSQKQKCRNLMQVSAKKLLNVSSKIKGEVPEDFTLTL